MGSTGHERVREVINERVLLDARLSLFLLDKYDKTNGANYTLKVLVTYGTEHSI